MPKLICTVGPQGCGKTTWAKQYMAEHQNTYRVNGDEVRAMAYVGKWNSTKEDSVNSIQWNSVFGLLKFQANVIWDNMNLSESAKTRCIQMAKETDAELVWQKFDTPIDQCILNDERRGSTIGRAIIENTFLRYGLIDWSEYRDLVIVDLDGTLTDSKWRADLYLSGPKKDWASFLARCGEDHANEGVLHWVLELQKFYDVVAVSGRNAAYWPQTRKAFISYGFNPKHIFMRGDGDHRPDYQVKNDILAHLPKEKIVFAIDDRPTVIQKVWRANGVKVYDVGGYNESW